MNGFKRVHEPGHFILVCWYKVVRIEKFLKQMYRGYHCATRAQYTFFLCRLCIKFFHLVERERTDKCDRY